MPTNTGKSQKLCQEFWNPEGSSLRMRFQSYGSLTVILPVWNEGAVVASVLAELLAVPGLRSLVQARRARHAVST